MSTAVYLYDISHAIIDNIQFMMGLTGRNIDRFYAQDLVRGGGSWISVENQFGVPTNKPFEQS
jgi:twinkle protein